MSKMFETTQLTTESGAKLQIYKALCKTAAKGVVHINHGLAEHAARYQVFALALNKAGFHVYAHDHRGHGQTQTRETHLGNFDSEDATSIVLADIESLHKHIHKEHKELPLVLFGHSMGGLIAMNYAIEHPEGLAGVAVWNSNFTGGILGRIGQFLLKWEKMRKGSDTPSQIIPKLTFDAWGKAIKGHQTMFDWLSHKPEEVDAYIKDPLCGWNASVGMWLTIFDWVFAGSNEQNLKKLPKDLPFMFLGGGKDPATDNGKAVSQQAQRLENAGLSSIQCTIHKSARHETLNDLDAEKATKDFIDWANHCIGAK